MTKYFLEIRNRFLLLFITYVSIVLVTYLYKETLLFLLINPNFTSTSNSLTFLYFIFTNVTELFSVYIQLIIFLSFQIGIIFFIYHIFVFFIPAFFKTEFIYIKNILKIVSTSWFVSMLTANYLIIPLTLIFFLSFQNLITDKSFSIYFEAKLSEYVDFYISLYYICGFYFQAFIILFFILNYINVISKNSVKKVRKLYYFSFVIFSTLISPPDVISQVLISIFLILGYELWFFLFLLKTHLIGKPVKTY